MVRFGRVDGVIRTGSAPGDANVHLTVTLDDGRQLRIVRDEPVPLLRPAGEPGSLHWHADQYTQETIATTLAEEGWEPIGVGEEPAGSADGIVNSPAYVVRNLG